MVILFRNNNRPFQVLIQAYIKTMLKKISTAIIFILLFSGVTIFFWPKKGYTPQISITQESEYLKEGVQKPSEPNPDSIMAMTERNFEGSDLKLVKILDENDFYTRYSITYTSEGLKISGIMNIPKGKGPFPVIVMNHGYIDPKVYTNGQGLKREQDFFARNGYAVLHSDYRGHAFSDKAEAGDEVRPRSNYVEDVLNAVSALKKSDLPELAFLDKEKIGMLGHSMGGGITENIMTAKPQTAKAYVLLAPISADYKKNFDKWVLPDPDFEGIAEKFYARYGTYEENPEVWKSFSAINYVDRITSPVMLHQGTADKDVPMEWSQEFANALKKAGKQIEYFEYPGEGHIFYKSQEAVMRRSLNFFDRYLKADSESR